MNMEELTKFLEQHEDQKRIWVLTHGGLVSGKLNTLEARDPEKIILSDALYLSGGAPVDLDTATIIVEHVIGWGRRSS